MKKFILAIALMLGFTISNAQNYTMLSSVGNSSDTSTNAETITLTKAVAGPFSVITVQATLVKISGTVAGKIMLQASVNGTNYVDLNSSNIICEPGGVDSFDLTNVATQSCMWTLTPSKYSYYRVAFVTTGTVSARATALIMARK